MAGDEQAKLDFTEILYSTDRKFDIIHAKWSEGKHFETKFRTQIQRNSEDFNALCDEWVDLFSEITNTVWVKKISNTGPKIRFRKQYQCWTHGGKNVQKELLFDARRCKGTLDMKVLTDNPQTRKKNKHIKMGLNVVVKINFTHLHKVDTINKYSFFVHACVPQIEAPKPIIHPNNNLPKLVAEMVQKGLNSTPKMTHPTTPEIINSSNNLLQSSNEVVHQQHSINDIVRHHSTNETTMLSARDTQREDQLLLGHRAGNVAIQNIDSSYHLNQILPVQNMESIKLEVQPQFQQVTQLMVSDPIDLGEPILLCQPAIMFDPTQVLPVTAHTLSSHFVQLHPSNLHSQQGHYL